MSQKKDLAQNTLLIGLSKVSTQFLTFLMLPLYTALLSTSEYGIVDLVISYGTLFAPLVLLNMEMAVFRHLIDARNNAEARRQVITNAFEITGIGCLIALAFYMIANLVFEIPMAATMAFYFFAVAISSITVQVARGLGKIKAFAITGIAQGVTSVVLNVIFLMVLNMGAEGLLLGLALGASIPAIVLAAILHLPSNIKLSARDRAVKKQLLGFSLPLIPNSISWWMFGVSDRTIISLVLGVAANGIYAISNKFSTVLYSLYGIFYMSWSESAALNINKPNRDSFFSDIANMSVRIFGTLASVGVALTPAAFPILINSSFDEALLYIPILMLGGLFNVVVGFYSAIYTAKKLTKQIMNTSIVAAALNLIVMLALVWLIGIWAAAISTVVAYLVLAINRHFDVKKYVKITYEKFLFVKILSLFAVVCVFYYWGNFYGNITSVIIAIAASWLLNRELIDKIWSLGIEKLRKTKKV